MSENFLTEAESKFIELTGQLANAFFELPEVHPADRGEFVAALHQIQNMVLARPAYRQLVIDDQCGGCPIQFDLAETKGGAE